MGRFSWLGTSESSDYSGNQAESGYSETDELIARDQAELDLKYPEPPEYPTQHPPQPEVEFGFPQMCYCGDAPILAKAKNEPWRNIYTCKNVDDGDCHVWKYWDVAVMEEIREMKKHLHQLEEKVDNLTFSSDNETDEKVVRLEQLVSDLRRKSCSLVSDVETGEKMVRLELLVCDLAKKSSTLKHGFEVTIGVLLLALVLLGLLMVFK